MVRTNKTSESGSNNRNKIVKDQTPHILTRARVASMSQVVGLPNNSYKPITNTAWVRAQLCKLQKGCIRLAAASDKIYQLLAHGRWFSPGSPASSTTKTGRHHIAEILLKVTLNTEIKSHIHNNRRILIHTRYPLENL